MKITLWLRHKCIFATLSLLINYLHASHAACLSFTEPPTPHHAGVGRGWHKRPSPYPLLCWSPSIKPPPTRFFAGRGGREPKIPTLARASGYARDGGGMKITLWLRHKCIFATLSLLIYYLHASHAACLSLTDPPTPHHAGVGRGWHQRPCNALPPDWPSVLACVAGSLRDAAAIACLNVEAPPRSRGFPLPGMASLPCLPCSVHCLGNLSPAL